MKNTIIGARIRRWRPAWLIPAFLATVFCAHRSARPVLGPDEDSAGAHALTGIASWYGEDFNGKPTSSRESYDTEALTAAHRTLPFQTRVRVVNLDNRKSVVVRINDRGPFINGRIIDLSLAAARAVDMVGPGTAPVRLEILSGPPPPAGPQFSVQIGSFLRKEGAQELEARLKDDFGPATIETVSLEGRRYYRVRLRAADRKASEALSRRLAEAGFSGLIFEEADRARKRP
jgi:rare lipoprotein A